ncbi:MAG: WG repeat-containing protein [Lachnospiraceae bacterium]|nr:WG repeat-containing protein [Lachnospiraceae bacterium]
MAIYQCKECGGKISTRYEGDACPHCGYPFDLDDDVSNQEQPLPEHKKPWKAILIASSLVAVVAVVAFACIHFDVFASNRLKITPEFSKAIERYDYIDAFSEGLAAVRRDGKWGYINLKGEEVIPCQFSNDYPVGQFSEGLACVVDERAPKDSKLINKRVGFINKKGEWVIEGEYYAQIPSMGTIWVETDHTLPSFKDGKCAVWNMAATDYEDENNWNSKIVLVDKNGQISDAADSIVDKMIRYQPYPTTKSYATERERKVVYDDYSVSICRDTVECDNGARLVVWDILDANYYPYYPSYLHTERYYLDKDGNSTLTAKQQETMKNHLDELVASISQRHQEQLEEERRRQEEEERRQKREWLYGTWEYNGTIDLGYYLGGVRRVSSKLIISEDNLKVYIDGRLDYNGTYEIRDGENEIIYNRHSGSYNSITFYPYNREIEFDRGKYYTKTSSSTSSSSYYSSPQTFSYDNSSTRQSSNTTLRTEADVWAYLEGRRFYGRGSRWEITQPCIYVNGKPATGGVRVSNIRGNSATLSASSPYLGGQTIIFYLNSSDGTIMNDGVYYHSR